MTKYVRTPVAVRKSRNKSINLEFKVKILGLFILTVLSTTLSVDWYVCQIKKECSVEKVAVVQSAVASVEPVQKISDNVEIIKGRIHFRVGAKKFLSSKKVQKHLLSVVEQWEQNPDQTITVTGHTDSKGNRKSNYKLGYRRGIAIKKALVHYGVAKNKVKVKSFGEAKPMSSNRTKKGRFYNRRVEIDLN